MAEGTATIRGLVADRLHAELGDPELASAAADALDLVTLDRFSADDIATTSRLAYRPTRVADDDVDTLWILAFGYRLKGLGVVEPGEEIPPMADLDPGPVNEALADVAAAFVRRRPVPIIAQWEVADLLTAAGVVNVISVEPDAADDGSVVYLSTAGVLAKGQRLAADAGIDPGRAGVLGHAAHVNRCLLTAAAAGLDAAVPAGVRLPEDFDPHSGQSWTRSRRDFIPLDLMARAYI